MDALLQTLGSDRIRPGSVDGLSLHWLTEALGFLWKLTLLEDLGFTADERAKLGLVVEAARAVWG